MILEFTRVNLCRRNEEENDDFGDYFDGDTGFQSVNSDDEEKDEDEDFESCTSAARRRR